jgi:hypothetical protein
MKNKIITIKSMLFIFWEKKRNPGVFIKYFKGRIEKGINETNWPSRDYLISTLRKFFIHLMSKKKVFLINFITSNCRNKKMVYKIF